MRDFETTNDMCVITDQLGNVLFSDIDQLNFFRKVIIEGRQENDETLYFYDGIWYEYTRKIDKYGRTIELLKDITKYKKQEEEYTIDALSELKVRKSTYKLIVDYILTKAGRNEEYACIYIDANKFKQINDEFGHEAGDMAITNIGKAINSSIRPDDIGGRLGGDEFLILLKNITEETAIDKMEQIINLVEETKFDTNKKLTISVGISIGNTCDIFLNHNSTLEERILQAEEIVREIMDRADKAMYLSKIASSESGISEYTTNYVKEGYERKQN